MSILKINKNMEDQAMSDDYKMVTFSDGKRKTYEKIIKEKTAEKKRELSRSLDNKADGLLKKDYPQFLKAIKVKKELELLKKATTDLKNFERSIEAPPRLPSTIKLYESKSIEGLLLDHREVKPIAVNDWQLIQNKLIGIKNN
jgi:hypothetical protein